MTPFGGNMYFSNPTLPTTYVLVSVSNPRRFFELIPHPSRALDTPCVLLPELQRNKDTARCVTLGPEVTRNR